MSVPRVSVVVPTRNRRQLLMQAVASVLGQRGVSVDLVVVDEASTDDTVAALEALADPRLRVVRHGRPVGVSGARNAGAAIATGAWLAFLDDDDVWAPDKLADHIAAAEGGRRDWAYSGAVNIDLGSNPVHGQPPPGVAEVMATLSGYNSIPGGGSNVVMRHDTWRRVGPFDSRLRNTEDWEMWLRLAKLGPPACVARPAVGYRIHGSNASLDTAEIVRGARLIESLHGTTADWGHLHRWMAESCLRRGQRGAALEHFAKAVLHGQARGVAADFTAVLRRKAGQRPNAGGRRDLWLAEAGAWLQPPPAQRRGAGSVAAS